jgi:hypothetical protein
LLRKVVLRTRERATGERQSIGTAFSAITALYQSAQSFKIRFWVE